MLKVLQEAALSATLLNAAESHFCTTSASWDRPLYADACSPPLFDGGLPCSYTSPLYTMLRHIEVNNLFCLTSKADYCRSGRAATWRAAAAAAVGVQQLCSRTPRRGSAPTTPSCLFKVLAVVVAMAAADAASSLVVRSFPVVNTGTGWSVVEISSSQPRDSLSLSKS